MHRFNRAAPKKAVPKGMAFSRINALESKNPNKLIVNKPLKYTAFPDEVYA